jgi:hypothetical protein
MSGTAETFINLIRQIVREEIMNMTVPAPAVPEKLFYTEFRYLAL